MSEVSSRRQSGRDRSVPVRGGFAVVLAVLANGILVIGIERLNSVSGFRTVSFPPVGLLSALGAGGAAIVYWALDRYVADVDRVFVRVAGAVLLLSFVPDLALLAIDSAATVPGVIVLMGMHVIVAIVSVGSLVYWGRE